MIGFARCIGTGTAANPFRPDATGYTGAIDLRPDPTVVDGWWIVRTPQSNADTFGDDPDAKLSLTLKQKIENKLGITLTGDQPLKRIIADLLLEHGDDASPSKWNTLKAGRDGWLRVHLGGMLWEQAVPSGGATITDDFNRADSTTLGGAGWSEVNGNAEIISNVVGSVVADTFTRIRTTSDLATVDHYAQITGVTYGTAGATFKRLAPMVRYATAADTAYEWRRQYGTTTDLTLATIRWQKIVAGTYTVLGSGVTDTAAAGEVLRAEVSGSTLTGKRDGTTKEAITDTSITTGTKAGVLVYSGSNAARIRGDNFEAGDLSAGATVAAVTATATAAAGVPAVSGGATVAAVLATATAQAQAPAATGGATVLAVAATATAQAAAPTVSTGAAVEAAAATATAQAHAPAVTAGATVLAVTATATAEAIAPTVSDGGAAGDGEVTAVAATAAAEAVAPTVTAAATIAPPAAVATAEAHAPSVSGGASVAAVTTTAAASAAAPTVTAGATVQALTATATATAHAPTLVYSATVAAVAATATATAHAPAVAGQGPSRDIVLAADLLPSTWRATVTASAWDAELIPSTWAAEATT